LEGKFSTTDSIIELWLIVNLGTPTGEVIMPSTGEEKTLSISCGTWTPILVLGFIVLTMEREEEEGAVDGAIDVQKGAIGGQNFSNLGR
jgi:hypothetical protein